MGVGSIISRIVNLHLLAIGITSILMPLALYAMLSTAAEDLHHRALGDQAAELAQYLGVMPDGTIKLDLPPRVRDLYSESYGRYEYAVLDATGTALFSSYGGVAPVAGLGRLQHSYESYFSGPVPEDGGRIIDDAIDIYVNNRLVARGEVVLVEDKLGVTMTEIIKAERN